MEVFLTGCTGFLAGELLVLLLQRPEIEKIFCMVRAKDGLDALDRVRKVVAFHNDIFDDRKIIPIRGELSNQNLCHDLMSNDSLRSVNVVIHAAANTSFSPIYRDIIRKINIEGAKRIFEWSALLPELDTFVYVGTSWICGKEKPNRIVCEDESPNIEYTQLTEYCKSKTIGEINVRQIIPHEKLLVVRPSTIVGDSRSWIPRSYGILWAIATCDLLRLLAVDPDAAIDIIPVDYASQAIIELLFRKRSFNTYHISAGTTSSTTLRRLLSAVNIHDRPPYKYIEYEILRLLKLFAKNKLRDMDLLNGLGEYLYYWRSQFADNCDLRKLLVAIDYYSQYVNLGLIFDNSRLLIDTGVGLPEPAHEYMKRNKLQLRAIDVIAGSVDP